MKPADSLLAEILELLEANPPPPVSVLAQKAYRLASLVGDPTFEECFRLHLFGPTKSIEAVLNRKGHGNDSARQEGVTLYMVDRKHGSSIQSHTLQDLESMLSVAESGKIGYSATNANFVFDLRRLLARARQRVAEFAIALPSGDAREARSQEQKFGILWSAGQEEIDFDAWSATAQSIAVVFCDIDDFKQLNSRFNEMIVDREVLPQFQELLAGLVRHRGEAYRHGGEEFVIILPNLDRNEANAFGERLCSEARELSLVVQGALLSITVSIGIAIWPADGDSCEKVLGKANDMEHHAKANGKNQCICSWDEF